MTARAIPEADRKAPFDPAERIAGVDGLRAVAVLGVIWAHTWAFSGTPALPLGSIGPVLLDLNRAISVVGTGVDLFFVISGFCMYRLHAGRLGRFTWRGYTQFLARRFARIAPAFYACALACAAGFVVAGEPFPARELAAHAAFLQTVVPGTGNLAAPFWSLATEWQFYLVLPFAILLGLRAGFWRAMALLAAASVGFRLAMFAGPGDFAAAWNGHLPARLAEFICGMCAARLCGRPGSPPGWASGARGAIAGAGIVLLGRLLSVTEVVHASGGAGFILRALSEPVLALGYAIVLWSVVAAPSPIALLLAHPALRAVGRWSYSLYLLHWWPVYWIATWMNGHLGTAAWVQYLSLAVALAVLIPAAAISFRYLELPYFRRHPHARERVPRLEPAGERP